MTVKIRTGGQRVNYTGRDSEESDNTFNYLGSTLSEDGELDAEVTHAPSAERLEELDGNVWVWMTDDMNVKILGKIYRPVVCPALLYGADTLEEGTGK